MNSKATWRRQSAPMVEQWMTLQKKTFTRWCNSYLRERGLEIEDLFLDVSDGILLLNLLEIIGQNSVHAVCGRRFNTKPKMRIHSMENCNLIFEYLEKRELQTVNISAQDIVDGNEKLVLGLLFTIILRFAVDEDGKQGLLMWCQRNVRDYGVDVQNFHRSWADGKAFCALIHRFRPDLLDYHTLGEDAYDNMDKAFAAAEEAGISKLLDVEDVCGSVKPDEKSIIAQLTLYFQAFAALAQRDALIEVIMRAYAVRRKHDQWISDYEVKSAELKAWVDEKRAALATPPSQVTTDQVRELLNAFYTYRTEEKPPRKGQLTYLEGLYTQLRTSEAINHRAIYVPAEGLDTAALSEGWTALQDSERIYEAELIRLYDALRASDFLVAKFTAKSEKVSGFYAEAMTVYGHGEDGSPPNYGNSVEKCQVLLEGCETHEQQYQLHAKMLRACEAIVGDVIPEHARHQEVLTEMARLQERDAEVVAAAAAFRSAVEAQLQEELDIVQKTKAFNAKAPPLFFLIDELAEIVFEPFLSGSPSAVQEAQSKLAQAKEKAEGAGESMTELFSLGAELVATERELPLALNHSTLENDYKLLNEAIAERESELAAALLDEEAKVAARESFAAASTDLKAFLDSRMAQAVVPENGTKRSPQESVEIFQGLKEAYDTEGAEKLAAAQAAAARQKEAGVFSNTLAPETMPTLEVDHEELGNIIHKHLDEAVAAAAAAESHLEMNATQAKEIRETFEALDQDKSGVLSQKEFTDGAQAIGLIMDAQELSKKYAELTKTSPGRLSVDGFAAFMLEQLSRGSSKEDVLTAFRGLASGSQAIAGTVMHECFADAEAKDWMLERMPAKGTDEKELDYGAFTEQLFSA